MPALSCGCRAESPETLSAGIADLVIETLHGGFQEPRSDRRRTGTECAVQAPGRRRARTGRHVIDRCNLTVLQEPGQKTWGISRRQHGGDRRLAALLPRGQRQSPARQGGVRSQHRRTRSLNAPGLRRSAGTSVSILSTTRRVWRCRRRNPAWKATTAGPHQTGHGIHFNQLLALANLPIQRFGSTLLSHASSTIGVSLLKQAHCHENLDEVMCRSLSVDWQGYLYDCDFNQMLGLACSWPVRHARICATCPRLTLGGKPDRGRDHCYGCTAAGQGSSCGGTVGRMNQSFHPGCRSSFRPSRRGIVHCRVAGRSYAARIGGNELILVDSGSDDNTAGMPHHWSIA